MGRSVNLERITVGGGLVVWRQADLVWVGRRIILKGENHQYGVDGEQADLQTLLFCSLCPPGKGSYVFVFGMSRLFLPVIGLLILTASPALAAEGISQHAYKLLEPNWLFGLPITNAMVTGWVISLALILLVRWMVKKPTLIPGTGQAVIETLVGGMRDLLTPIVGKAAMVGVFPFLLALFSFIMIHNWSGLLPGVGSFGYYNEEGSLRYWVRPANADLNMTLGLAVVAMIAWFYYCIRYAGVGMFAYELFGNKADRSETPFVIYLLLIPIFFSVGIIEMVSIAFRPLSLSFRLYGNVFGGENLLARVSDLFAYILPVPFYFFELMVGVVQAFIFTLLVAIYIGLVCNHGDDEAHAH